MIELPCSQFDAVVLITAATQIVDRYVPRTPMPMNTTANTTYDDGSHLLSVIFRTSIAVIAVVAVAAFVFLGGGCASATPTAAAVANQELQTSLDKMQAPIASTSAQADRIVELAEQEKAEKLARLKDRR